DGGQEIEASSFRVRVVGPVPALDLRPREAPVTAAEKRKGVRQAWFGAGFVEAAVYDRYALVPGDRIAGPAIVEEREATTVVPPGDTLRVDANLNLRLASGVAAAPRALGAPGMSLAAAIAGVGARPI